MKRLLHIAGQVLEICDRRSSTSADDALRFDHEPAAALLTRYAREPTNLIALRSYLAGQITASPVHRLTDTEVIAEIARALTGRRALAFQRLTPPLETRGHPGDLDSEAAPPRQIAPTVKTWIEIELVDLEGEPVKGARYWIQLTDGSIREGWLDGRGQARVDGLDPGMCEIRWPDHDEEAVAFATIALAPPPPEEVLFDPGAPTPSDLDSAAQARALVQAAQDGVPFCEECEKARKKQQSRATEAR